MSRGPPGPSSPACRRATRPPRTSCAGAVRTPPASATARPAAREGSRRCGSPLVAGHFGPPKGRSAAAASQEPLRLQVRPTSAALMTLVASSKPASVRTCAASLRTPLRSRPTATPSAPARAVGDGSRACLRSAPARPTSTMGRTPADRAGVPSRRTPRDPGRARLPWAAAPGPSPPRGVFDSRARGRARRSTGGSSSPGGRGSAPPGGPRANPCREPVPVITCSTGPDPLPNRRVRVLVVRRDVADEVARQLLQQRAPTAATLCRVALQLERAAFEHDPPQGDQRALGCGAPGEGGASGTGPDHIQMPGSAAGWTCG